MRDRRMRRKQTRTEREAEAIAEQEEMMEEKTLETLIQEASYWEDPDAALLVGTADEAGNIYVARCDYSNFATAPTLREALQRYINGEFD